MKSLSIKEKRILVRKAKRGDQAAFQEYRKSIQPLLDRVFFAYAKYLLPDQHDDLWQEVDLGFWQGIQKYDETLSNGAPDAYVIGWARAYAARYGRNNGEEAQSRFSSLEMLEEDGMELEIQDCSLSAGDVAVGVYEEVQFVKQVLGNAGLTERELYVAENQILSADPRTNPEIADDLGIGTETAREAGISARNKLAQALRMENDKND